MRNPFESRGRHTPEALARVAGALANLAGAPAEVFEAAPTGAPTVAIEAVKVAAMEATGTVKVIRETDPDATQMWDATEMFAQAAPPPSRPRAEPPQLPRRHPGAHWPPAVRDLPGTAAVIPAFIYPPPGGSPERYARTMALVDKITGTSTTYSNPGAWSRHALTGPEVQERSA